MKKVLSFVLVLAMILGCTAMAFADTATEKIAKGPFADAPTAAIATILKDMGVLFGDENGNALLDKTISRAEFCAIVLRALGLEEVSKGKAKTKFADVPYDAWYSGYVATALAKKLADGKSETVFDPAGTVTADEALAFVVKGLGYDQAHLEGEWPMNYRLAAKDLGILPADYDFDNKEIKREDVFEVLYKALEKTLVEWNAKNEMWVHQGIGETNMKTRLGVTASYEVTAAQVVTSDIVSAIKTATKYDYSDYLGQQATVVKKGTQYIGLGKVATTTLTGTFESKTTFAAVDGTKYAIAEGMFAANAVAKINGVEVTSAQAIELVSDHALDCDPVELELTFKDGKINTIYGASYWKETDVVMVSTKAAAYFADGNYASAAALNDGFEKFTTTVGLKVAGAVDDYTEIEADDIVYIYNGKNSDSEAITALYVVRDVVYGSVSRYNNVTSKITVDGTQYAYVDSLLAGTKITASTTAAYYFFLDADEKIIAIKKDLAEEEAKVVYNYAFVLGTGYKASTTSSELDGAKTPKEYQIRLLPVGETESEDFVGITTTKAIASVVDEDKNWTVVPGDVVKYSLDEDGEFTSLTKIGSVSGITTKHEFKANSVDGKLYASDVVIVNVISTGAAELKKAANYQLKTVADIKALSFAAVVVTNAAGKVDTIIINGAGTAKSSVTTYAAVAIVGYYDAKYVDLLGEEFYEGVEVKSGLPTINEANMKLVYKVTLVDGKTTVFTNVSGTEVTIEKYEDGVVNGGAYQIDDATILKWNKTDKVYEESDESALVKDAKAYFVDTDADGIYDFVAVH